MAAISQLNVIDRLVGWVNPRAGLERHFHRQRLARAYEAASPRDTWRPRRQGASANADHSADATVLRAKARALLQNVPYVQAGINAKVNYTIGTGIVPRATGRQADIINERFGRWMKVCDADGRLDFMGMEAAAYRAMEVDGEVLVRLRSRRSSDGLPVPLQLQLVEIDYLDTSRTGTEGGNLVINGVEQDFLGRVVAYWLWDQHPGDINLRRGGNRQSRRVPASSVIHLYAPDRPGQGRGFTGLASVIPRVRDLQLYEDSELARKNLEARLSVLASGDVATLGQSEYTSAVDPVQQARTTGNLGELASGSITELPPGVNVTVIEPKAAPGYVEYVKQQLHVIAAGIGVTYEMLTGDMSEVNYSSARVRLMQFRQAVEQMRWLTVIPRLLDPIWRAMVDAMVLEGVITNPDYAVDYATPKWDYVNPEQDVKADVLEISAGLATLSEKLRQRGYKPAEVMAEWARDWQMLDSLGIEDKIMFLLKGANPGDPAARTEAQARADQVEQLLRLALQKMGTIEAQVCAMAARDINVNVEGSTLNVEPAQVNVAPAQNHMNLSVPVHVEAHIDPDPAGTTTVVNERMLDGRIVSRIESEKLRAKRAEKKTIVSERMPDGTTVTRVVEE